MAECCQDASAPSALVALHFMMHPSTAVLQVTAALEENRLLVKLIAALQPHKHSFTLQPPGRGPSRGSKNGTGAGTTPSSSGLTQPDTPGTSKQLRGGGRGSLSGEGHNPGGRPCCLCCWPDLL